MKNNIIKKVVNNTCHIDVQERLTFAELDEFRAAYKYEPENRSFVLECKNLNNFDEAALGLLLELYEHAGGAKADMVLMNCNALFKKMLRESKIDKLFMFNDSSR